MRPEHELLLSCVRAAFPNDRTDPPPAFPETVDWNRFIGLSEWHNVAPLVYRVLPDACMDAIPRAAMDRLRGLCQNNTARALFLASELSRILKAFKSSGIPACPFKGPALSVMLYGDPARRQSKDLDILVPKERVRKAIDCLDTLGYGAKASLASHRLAAHRRTEYELQFFRHDGKLQVEIQWAVVPGFFGFDHRKLNIGSSLAPRLWNGHSFPVFPPEETLLLLCVHGAKHLWCKLGWIADVAGLLASPAPPDLTRTFELAGRCGVTRLLCVGLLLAKRLAGASLPEHISARIDADLMARSLSRKALDVVAKTPVNPDVDPARYLFYFKAKDCRIDQLLFAGRLMATLAAGEWNPSALPDSLYPLYYVLRPLDLLRKHAGAQLRHLLAASRP
jgi:hypothetical protein